MVCQQDMKMKIRVMAMENVTTEEMCIEDAKYEGESNSNPK